MMVIDWIVQIITFFLAWRVFHYATVKVNEPFQGGSLVRDLAVNVAIAILLLIVLTNVHTLWWLMPTVGAAIGILGGQMGGRSKR